MGSGLLLVAGPEGEGSLFAGVCVGLGRVGTLVEHGGSGDFCGVGVFLEGGEVVQVYLILA